MPCDRRCAYFLPQPLRCLPFGLPRLRRAQLRDAPPAGKKHGGRGKPVRQAPAPPQRNGASPHDHTDHDPHGHRRHRRSGDRPGPSRRRPGRGRVRLDGHPRRQRPGRSCRTGQARDGTPEPGPTSSSPSPAPAIGTGNCSATEPVSRVTPPRTGSGPRTRASRRSPPRCSSTGPPASPTDRTTSPPRPRPCLPRTGDPTPAGPAKNSRGAPATTGRDAGSGTQKSVDNIIEIPSDTPF